MEPSWKIVWREGIVPLVGRDELVALRDALRSDDPKLVQGCTVSPPPLQSVQDWHCEAACGSGFMGWRGGELDTVAEVEEFFARMCFNIDQRLGEPAACRWFLNWFDETPRDEMIRLLLPEVETALEGKPHGCTTSTGPHDS
jgi:hypothetical protein